jgi:hypothetical protein
MLRAASGVLLVWLVSAVVADAAPASRRVSAGSACSAQTLTVKKLRRQFRSFGGPFKRFMKRRAAAPLFDGTPRLSSSRHAIPDDDDAAIQNDAPVAGIDEDTQPILSLQPIGLLHGSSAQRPRTRPFSPRSPRGPPLDV